MDAGRRSEPERQPQLRNAWVWNLRDVQVGLPLREAHRLGGTGIERVENVQTELQSPPLLAELERLRGSQIEVPLHRSCDRSSGAEGQGHRTLIEPGEDGGLLSLEAVEDIQGSGDENLVRQLIAAAEPQDVVPRLVDRKVLEVGVLRDRRRQLEAAGEPDVLLQLIPRRQ